MGTGNQVGVGLYDNLFPTWFLTLIECSKIPTLGERQVPSQHCPSPQPPLRQPTGADLTTLLTFFNLSGSDLTENAKLAYKMHLIAERIFPCMLHT